MKKDSDGHGLARTVTDMDDVDGMDDIIPEKATGLRHKIRMGSEPILPD